MFGFILEYCFLFVSIESILSKNLLLIWLLLLWSVLSSMFSSSIVMLLKVDWNCWLRLLGILIKRFKWLIWACFGGNLWVRLTEMCSFDGFTRRRILGGSLSTMLCLRNIGNICYRLCGPRKKKWKGWQRVKSSFLFSCSKVSIAWNTRWGDSTLSLGPGHLTS